MTPSSEGHTLVDSVESQERKYLVTTRRVAVSIGAERQYHRGVLQGIARYARLHGDWELDAEPSYQGGEVPAERIHSAAGVIMFISDRRRLHTARRWRVPIVNMSSLFPDQEFFHVSNDGTSLAQMALEHFIERGFRHFAYCELDQHSHIRSQRFGEQLTVRGLTGHFLRVRHAQRHDWVLRRDNERLETWLQSLPKPVAILAHNDIRGRHVADACRRLRIDVPDEVAILGIDNELPHCEMCNPPLSSIITDAERIGFEAAAMLNQLMNGKTPALKRLLIPPLGIATRQSTDVTATTDRYVAQAVRFIREHACSGIDVADVLKRVVISRTALDKRFVAALGHSPHEEIARVRLKRARELLSETDLSIDIIAERTGFRHGEYLGVVFRRAYQQTPGEFRAQNRTKH